MNRIWIGILLLLLLLGTGIWITASFTGRQEEIANNLSLAGDAAQAGDWAAAEHYATQAQNAWNRQHRFASAITDHSPMEQIDGMFAQMEIFLQARQQAAFCACCAELEVMVQAVGESQSINWWNLL